MAGIVTLAQMRTRARYMAKMESSTFVSDSEVDALIIAAVQRVTDRLHGGGGQEYERLTYETNTVVGTSLYDLPTDFYRLQLLQANRAAVMPVASNNWLEAASDAQHWRTMFPFMLPEDSMLRNITSGGWELYRYRIRGRIQGRTGSEYANIALARQIEILPVPRTVFTLRLDYQPTGIVEGNLDGAQKFDGLNGFELIPILEAAIFMLGMEESDTSVYERQLARQEARLDEVAPSQDAGRHERMVNVYGDDADVSLYAGRRASWSPY